ncbi:hypothetical protein B0A69_11800 [Chryseobacterium shigense]|nr:hypothetical protein B0A69_11800 [Chryseobacterium shigense]
MMIKHKPMKKFIPVLLAFFFVHCTNTTDSIEEEVHLLHSKTAAPQYDIFLIAGQSNTHYGIGYDPMIDTVDPDIFQVGRRGALNNKIVVASETLHHWTSNNNKIGFGLTFAKKYKQYLLKPDRKILLVPCGYGGTTIQQWSKNTTLYNDAVKRTLTALNNNPGSSIKGILWHQGEHNVNTTNYTTLLDKFIGDIRRDLNDPNLPIVLGGMVPFWVNRHPSRIAQQEKIKTTPNRVNNSAYADPTFPFEITKLNNSYDHIHFDAKGQRELGLRYFEKYNTLVH